MEYCRVVAYRVSNHIIWPIEQNHRQLALAAKGYMRTRPAYKLKIIIDYMLTMLPGFYPKLLFFPLLLMASSNSLYSADDHTLQIASSKQFSDLVYKKQKAFFVQFYSSKDANSASFAPIWKKLVSNVDEWSNIAQLAAVDCELEGNAELCKKEHSVNAYPTLKYFKYDSANAQDGQLYEGKKTKVDDLAAAIARYVLLDFEKQKPPEWPNFALAHDNKPGENLWSQETHYLALIFEQYPATGAPEQIPIVGVQVMLDFSKDRELLIRRGTGRHQFARANDIAEFPGLLMFSRSHEGAPVYKSRDGLTREEIFAKMHRYMDVTSKEHGHDKQREDL